MHTYNIRVYNSIQQEEDMPLPIHMIYILIKSSFLSFGRNKPLISSEATAKLHLAYLHDTKEVCLSVPLSV